MSVNASRVPAATIATLTSLESRIVMRKLLVGAVIGVFAGALIGGLTFGAFTSDTTATAFLRLQNPADLAAIAGGASQITPDSQDSAGKFVAGEIAYLSGEGFAQAVGRKMAEDEPALLNVAQANESSVVTISNSSATGDEATRTVQTAIDVYAQTLARRIDEQLRIVLPALSDWQQRDVDNAARVQDLRRVRESVQLQADQASRLLVVQPPTANHASSQRWVIGMFLGALVGGSGVAAVLLARRRRAGRGSLVKTMTEGVDAVLLPAVDLDMPPRHAWADGQARLGRTLYAQCPSVGPNRVILVVDAAPSSGGSVVAELLEMAAVDSQSVATASGQHSARNSVEPSATRVVAGGAVGESILTPELVAAATEIVLVGRIEADTVAQALALRAAAASGTAPVVAVFTHHRSRGARFELGRAKERRSAPLPTTDVADDEMVVP